MIYTMLGQTQSLQTDYQGIAALDQVFDQHHANDHGSVACQSLPSQLAL